MSKITPFLWFDDNAEEALEFYCSVFKNSKVLNTSRYGEGAPRPAGMVMMANLELEGQELILLNGGPEFKFTEAFSLFVSCDGQDEVDWYWSQLSAGGEESQCGWLKDKFGLSWQIVPADLGKYLGGPDPAGAQRAMQAMLQMRKLDIAALRRVYDGE
jgi:predicted 3-demethylubiquinone-9 3-methyltransferase (glyoxalase superfamily)